MQEIFAELTRVSKQNNIVLSSRENGQSVIPLKDKLEEMIPITRYLEIKGL
ncbi:MAG: hypothetical protein P4L42_12145 [Desulfocapsaceae bacterium]|nr:hypothetical protein [Desulfocapsaceae bacterium]